MKHIVVDLEMNTIRRHPEAKGICTMETIEIGAVMLDENLHEISSFRTYLKPEYNDSIAPGIRKLTGITDEMVENAPRFREAFHMFSQWCLGTGDEVTIYAWSTNDYNQIVKEMMLKDYEMDSADCAVMDREWTDFQKDFDSRLGFEKQVSLKTALEMAGVEFSGREHDALDDARHTAELLQLYSDEELFETTLKKIEEVMKPSSLGSTLGSMFDFSAFSFA